MTATLTNSKIYGPDTQKKEKGKLVKGGMGGFLCPPNHPEHDFHVETDLRKRPENRGGMSLSAAVEASWLDGFTKAAARVALAGWERQPIDSPKVVAWIQQVLGYFKGCYANPAAGERQWNADSLIIDKRNPMDKPEDHAGVNLIRRYYPEYKPTHEDFENAKWGS
jgi:hypothetical protein